MTYLKSQAKVKLKGRRLHLASLLNRKTAKGGHMTLETVKLAILVVDDDETVRLYLKTLLGKQFQVFTASNRQEALAILKEKPIDIVLLDLILAPGDDGLANLKAIKQLREEVDVIVVSGVSMVQTVVQTMKEGAIDYIEKPIEKE